MKKIFVIAALFASMAVASAQQLGFKGGLTLSGMNGADAPKDNKSMALYEAGILIKADLGAGFAVQPALAYQVKGASLKQTNLVNSKTGFVEASLGLQWGPDLLAFRPYVFVEPFVGYGVTGTETLTGISTGATAQNINEALQDLAKNKLEYGVGAGLGLEITSHIQLSCQLFRNFGKLYKDGELDKDTLKNIKPSYKDLKNYQGLKLTLAILF
jgi:hypothetical protein